MMKSIGIVLPDNRNMCGFARLLFKKRYEIKPVAEYGFRFVAVYDSCNYNRIFKRNNVESIVTLSESPILKCDYSIIDGDKVFFRMLPDYIRKVLKSKNAKDIAIVDKRLSMKSQLLIDKLLDISSEINIYTGECERANVYSDKIMKKYGAVINAFDELVPIKEDIVIVIEACENKISKDAVVIDRSNRFYNNVINDFYIEFKIKPPFSLPNVVFAECLDVLGINYK